MIWLPEDASSDQAEQQAFIGALQKVAGLQRGADLVTGDLESFKGAIHAALQKMEKPAVQTLQAEKNSKLVYLICDQRDRPATIPLRKFLKAEGIRRSDPGVRGRRSDRAPSEPGAFHSL